MSKVHRTSLIAVAVALAVTLSGCDLVDDAEAFLVGEPPAVPEVVPAGSDAPTGVVACLDGSLSFGPDWWSHVTDHLGRAIESHPTQGSGELTLWVRTIDAASADRGLTPLVVPPVAFEPAEPDYDAHPFEAGQLRTDYQTALTDVAHQQDRAVQAARQAAAEVAELAYPAATTTDVWGCLQVATELLAGIDGRRVVLLASDLEHDAVMLDPTTVPLDGIDVLVAPWKCEDTTHCPQLRAQWTDQLGELGAESVEIRRPESPLGMSWTHPSVRDDG